MDEIVFLTKSWNLGLEIPQIGWQKVQVFNPEIKRGKVFYRETTKENDLILERHN